MSKCVGQEVLKMDVRFPQLLSGDPPLEVCGVTHVLKQLSGVGPTLVAVISHRSLYADLGLARD